MSVYGVASFYVSRVEYYLYFNHCRRKSKLNRPHSMTFTNLKTRKVTIETSQIWPDVFVFYRAQGDDTIRQYRDCQFVQNVFCLTWQKANC